MKSNQSKKPFLLRIITGILIISLGLFWLIRSQHSAAEKVLTVLPRFSLTCLVTVILLDSLQIFFMAVRFWFLYPKQHRGRLKSVFTAMSVGQTMNAFLPARAGDFYKVATLTPKPAKPDFGVLALTGILTADKLVDTAAFLVLIIAIGSYKESLTTFQLPSMSTWKWALPTAIALICLWQFFLKKRLAKLTEWLKQFIQGLKSLLSPKQLFMALSFAILVWICEAFALQQLGTYQGFALSLSQSFFVLTMLNIAIAVPISVANIGPFEASIAFSLTKFGMPLESALAVATVHHGLQVTAYVLCGALGWLLRRLTPNSNQVAL